MFDSIRKQIKVSNLPLIKLAIAYSLMFTMGVATGLLVGWQFPLAVLAYSVIKSTIRFWYDRLFLKWEHTEKLHKLGPEDFASSKGLFKDPTETENPINVYKLVEEILEKNKDVFKGMYLEDPLQPQNGGIAIYFLEESSANAFASGFFSRSVVTIHQGLLAKFDLITDLEKRKAALSGVIVHELGHVLYRHSFLGFIRSLFVFGVNQSYAFEYEPTPKNLMLINILSWLAWPYGVMMNMISRQQEFQADSVTARCIYERSAQQQKQYPNKPVIKTYHTGNKNLLLVVEQGNGWMKQFKGFPDFGSLNCFGLTKKVVVEFFRDWKNGLSEDTLKLVSRTVYPVRRWYQSLDTTHPVLRARMRFIDALKAEQQPEYENKGWLERGRDVLLFEFDAWTDPLESDEDFCKKYDKLTHKPLVV